MNYTIGCRKLKDAVLKWRQDGSCADSAHYSLHLLATHTFLCSGNNFKVATLTPTVEHNARDIR